MVIDCDVRSVVPGLGALRPYLDAHWRDAIDESDFQCADEQYLLLPASPVAASPSVVAGSTRADVLANALERLGSNRAIVWPRLVPSNVRNPDVAAALASACNEWQATEWLSGDDRLRGSIVIDVKQPAMAAREIDRVARRAPFAQAMLPIRSEMLYGNREMWPIYEAAVRNGVAVALHAGGRGGTAPTSSGYPSYDVETYVGMSQILESHLMNLIAEGVFDRFPDLRVALVGAGWSWLPAWMWRMDKEWKGLQREIPWVREPPSAYMRRHMRLTLQPIDPPDDVSFLKTIEHLGSEEMLLFSSSYPEERFGSIDEALSPSLPEALRDRILEANARDFYGFA